MKRPHPATLTINLGLLAYFKYAGFFIDSWIDAWAHLGVTMNRPSLQIILPVGISFYTFQTLSYSIDVYRRQLKPTRDFIAFATFVAFFPQLVAGPIERARNFLPQILKPRTFDSERSILAIRQILWGFVKKVVLADTCALFVNPIFEGPASFSGPVLVAGALLFAIQVYGDFSGYSDIAIGTARLFGIDLMVNFRTPHFARSIPEFWRRWHISLSTWFRDYVYFPLGGSRGSRWRTSLNTLAVFMVSGLWHGASWNFVVWGFIHACLFLPSIWLPKKTKSNPPPPSFLPSFRELGGILFVLFAVAGAHIFFRSPSLGHAIYLIKHIPSLTGDGFPSHFAHDLPMLLVAIAVVVLGDWISDRRELLGKPPRPVNQRFAIDGMLLGFVLLFRPLGQAFDFIYFQF